MVSTGCESKTILVVIWLGAAKGTFRQAIKIDAEGKSSGKFTARGCANLGSGNVGNRWQKKDPDGSLYNLNGFRNRTTGLQPIKPQ